MESTIITKGVENSVSLRHYINDRVNAALKCAEKNIHFITVRVSDINGPKGGVDKRCQIHLKLLGLPSVVVTEASADTYGAIDGAMSRASRVVERTISRAKDVPAINVPVLRRIAA